MAKLQLNLFDRVTIKVDNILIKGLSQKSIGLIIYLAMSKERLLSRDVLASYFWENNDQKTARYNLRSAIWKINKSIDAINLIHTEKGLCCIHPELELKIDALQLEHCYKYLDICEIETLDQIISLYKNDFLEGLFFKNATIINDWIFNMRQYYQRQYFEIMMYLGDTCLSNKKFIRSQCYYEKLLKINPLHEETYLKLMENRTQDNDRVAAIKYFKLCESRLRDELNIDPNELLQDKYNSIIGPCEVEESELKASLVADYKIMIDGVSYFDYEFVSRLVDKLFLYVDITLLSDEQQTLIYNLKPIYPQVSSYLTKNIDNKSNAKHDIGIYYGLITLLDVWLKNGDYKLIISNYKQLDLPSKKLLSAINSHMSLKNRGILII